MSEKLAPDLPCNKIYYFCGARNSFKAPAVTSFEIHWKSTCSICIGDRCYISFYLYRGCITESLEGKEVPDRDLAKSKEPKAQFLHEC